MARHIAGYFVNSTPNPALRVHNAVFIPMQPSARLHRSSRGHLSFASSEEPLITGMHAVVYSRDAEADRAFFRDALGFPFVDAGDGWLIFALPPSEVACHPDETGGKHELYLMCDDVKAEVSRLSKKNIECGPVSDEGWGLLTMLRLPSGGELGLYQPRHAVPARDAKEAR
jgi:hypothetical protein